MGNICIGNKKRVPTFQVGWAKDRYVSGVNRMSRELNLPFTGYMTYSEGLWINDISMAWSEDLWINDIE